LWTAEGQLPGGGTPGRGQAAWDQDNVGITGQGDIGGAGLRALNALPVGLAPSAEVARPVEKGEIVSWDDVKLDEGSTVVKLRRQQDALD